MGIILEEGNESPFAKPPRGDFFSMIVTDYIGLTYVMHMPDPTEEEIEFVKGHIKGVCWHTSEECPIGALMLLLTNTKGEQWNIVSLISGSIEGLRNWGNRNRDNNACCIVLVDTNTNKIVSIRTFVLPADLIDALGSTMQEHADMDLAMAVKYFNHIESKKQLIWDSGNKWFYDDTQENCIKV